MIVMERKTPKKILTFKALLRRLDPSDKDFSYFVETLARLEYGYEGEHRVDREWLEMSFLDEHYLFFSYEIENEAGHVHQVDTLLITKRFLLMIEIKNIAGQVDYDEEKHQFMRTRSNGGMDILTNPFDQLHRHGDFFGRLLTNLKCPLPIEKAVVMANQSTIIGNCKSSIPIFHVSGLRAFVQKCIMKHQNQITSYQLDKLKKYLLKAAVSRNYDLNISEDRLKKGVLCENCNYQIQMQYKHGNWTCPKCKTKSKKAFYQALDDYRLLISNKITNREFRDFFDIKSIDAASKILVRLELESGGTTRDRYYIISEDILKRGI